MRLRTLAAQHRRLRNNATLLRPACTRNTVAHCLLVLGTKNHRFRISGCAISTKVMRHLQTTQGCPRNI